MPLSPSHNDSSWEEPDENFLGLLYKGEYSTEEMSIPQKKLIIASEYVYDITATKVSITGIFPLGNIS